MQSGDTEGAPNPPYRTQGNIRKEVASQPSLQEEEELDKQGQSYSRSKMGHGTFGD